MKKKTPGVHLHMAENGEFYATIIAANGRQLFRTSETYKRRAGVRNAIQSVLKLFTRLRWDGEYIDHTETNRKR